MYYVNLILKKTLWSWFYYHSTTQVRKERQRSSCNFKVISKWLSQFKGEKSHSETPISSGWSGKQSPVWRDPRTQGDLENLSFYVPDPSVSLPPTSIECLTLLKERILPRGSKGWARWPRAQTERDELSPSSCRSGSCDSGWATGKGQAVGMCPLGWKKEDLLFIPSCFLAVTFFPSCLLGPRHRKTQFFSWSSGLRIIPLGATLFTVFRHFQPLLLGQHCQGGRMVALGRKRENATTWKMLSCLLTVFNPNSVFDCWGHGFPKSLRSRDRISYYVVQSLASPKTPLFFIPFPGKPEDRNSRTTRPPASERTQVGKLDNSGIK